MDSGIDVELKGIDNPQMQGSQTAKKHWHQALTLRTLSEPDVVS